MTDVRVRQARPGDVEAIRAFTAETWTDREDYLGDVVDEWIAGDDETQHTLVAEDGEVAGVVQTVLLSDHESWQQGMRVAPGHRGEGVATALSTAGFEWARDRGAAVARAWVFGWNEMGLGLARAAGFEPATEFRFVHPDPDPGAETGSDCEVTTDPDAGWAAWRRSAARDHLRGLAMDAGESWAVSEATR